MSDSESETKPTMDRLKASKNVAVAFKLNGKNYPLWSRLMKIQIGSRKALSHIRDEPPEINSKEYRDWEETDLIVFSWIIDNIENDIIADFAHHQTAKAIWDNLAITFESKADKYLVYNLEDKATSIRQENLDLETYYRRIHGLWVNVDRCQEQPVTCCDKGIKQYREHANMKRLFKFLAGLNAVYDPIRRDILKEEPLPSVEAAYGWVKQEAARRKIMPPASTTPTTDTAGIGSADASSGEIGFGFGVQSHRPANRGQPRSTATGNHPPPGGRPDKSKLWCDHCGKPNHTRENCFRIIGYPEWWDEKQKGRAQAKFAVGVAGTGQRSIAQNQNREGATSGGGGQPRTTQPDPITSGGGTGNHGGVRAGNLAERAISTEAGNWGKNGAGIGFGFKPNPNNFKTLQFSPRIITEFDKRPISLSMTPQILGEFEIYPRNC